MTCRRLIWVIYPGSLMRHTARQMRHSQERRLMQAYVDSQPHQGISMRLDHYCDEASFVDWEQASPDLPDWQTSWRHLTADGKTAELTHPSAANQTRDFPPPVEPPPTVS